MPMDILIGSTTTSFFLSFFVGDTFFLSFFLLFVKIRLVAGSMLIDMDMDMDMDMLMDISSGAASAASVLPTPRYRCLMRFNVVTSMSEVISSTTLSARRGSSCCWRLTASAPVVRRARAKRKSVTNFIMMAGWDRSD